MKEEALKLAEIFEEVGRAKYPYHLDAAEMLRQQADRIAELEYDLKSLAKRYKALNRTKPLSDEEILDLCPPNHSEMMNEAYTIDFARAIEERHGIK